MKVIKKDIKKGILNDWGIFIGEHNREAVLLRMQGITFFPSNCFT
jgi:hypothetical protein